MTLADAALLASLLVSLPPASRSATPVGGQLYSLLHLGGFAGYQRYYQRHSGMGRRVLEMGCGDGRIAAALCLGEMPLAVLQQQMGPEAGDLASDSPDAGHTMPLRYVGIERCGPFAAKAAQRLSTVPAATIIEADFLEPLPADLTAAFDAVVVSANTLFCTPRHEDFLERCCAALAPGGVILADVYNALPWHEDATSMLIPLHADEGEDGDAWDELSETEEDVEAPLVQVVDESGREWVCVEREPDIDAEQQTIAQAYDFTDVSHASPSLARPGSGEEGLAGERHTETLVHHYLLPEQLATLLDRCGFDVEAMEGDFTGGAFDAEESEHVVVRAKKR